LEYVPLRKNNLGVSSQRLADFIIKIFPLQTIGFYVITFGEGMKKYIKNVPNMLDSGADIRVLKKISDLKKKKNPFLRDYINFHSHRDLQYYWRMGIKNEELDLREILGLIDYSETIIPFDEEIWNGVNIVRNEIVHRNRTEAKLEDVMNGIASLIIIASRFENWDSLRFEFRSEVFDYGWRIPRFT